MTADLFNEEDPVIYQLDKDKTLNTSGQRNTNVLSQPLINLGGTKHYFHSH